ncbi:ADP-ribosylation factor-binding protein GGA2 [Fusarium oxysporum f. sp. cubense race 1]|uniref:ADP-ribosylation factor-binding protein GGA2 n=1 Tax=Fusarium oxysporum f. sp. cubense (strain race 1) TaxID=1229664 RepID=N4UA81_FUSC1|nr:ADP-ribosylation factor-binding protein GGA2 [Fusarium oxysporum f. sp. cubense race 1]
MEAASARAAARDRWGDLPSSGRTPSQLQRFIQAACSPENYEPNLALNLEIADLINSKKGSAPREAATAIVNYINHRNPNVALLALGLLDICVKNCGYPFHLQIGTKEFLNELVNLKSAEEMEEEEREAQSAKLQELIRRGTPEDLQEANRLMKIMAGYDTRSKTDYRAKAAEEVAKIQAKARLLEERLDSFKEGDKMEDGDVFSELAAALQSAQPKIQKMCEEESDDHEAVAKLLEINDSIHRTAERYKLMKKGDIEGAAKVAAGGPPPSAPGATASSSSATNELSLIDFDVDASSNGAQSSNAAAPSANAGGLENDLLGLDIGGESSSFGQGGGIALGFGANQNIPGPALLSSMTQDNSARGQVSTPTPPPFSQFASFSQPVSQSTTPQPHFQQQPPPPSQPASDPFAILGAGNLNSQRASPAPPQPQPAATANDDDEWNFSSALPPEPSKPKEHKAVVSNTNVKIEMIARRAPGNENAINIVFAFSNNVTQPIGELHFQLAVTKGYELQLKPQTGRDLAPQQNRGITQEVQIWHAGNRAQKVTSAKLRWRASYKTGEQTVNEMGEVTEFSLA